MMKARDVMTTPVVYVTPNADVEECLTKMEQNQIRRLPVLDAAPVVASDATTSPAAGDAPPVG